MTEAAETVQTKSYKVSAFPVQQAAPSFPVTVRAPIVIDARTEQGCKPLLDYIASLSHHSNVDVARAEGRRLRPYFSAMSIYLTRAIEKKEPGAEGSEELKVLTTPKGLSKLFSDIAAYSRTTMISDVVVMADDIKSTGPAKHLFANWREFKTGYDYCGREFNFGFLQAFEGGDKDNARSGTTFPTLMLDHEMVEALPANLARPVLRDFQGVMTLVNHDMLHHFTATYIGGNTVFKTEQTKDYGGYQDPVKAWGEKLPYFGHGEAYEEWAQMGQEKVLLAPGNEALVEDVRKKLDHYMDGLERVRDTLLAGGSKGEAPDAVKIKKTHEVIDYFGMVMAHALTRVFPLNHEMMQHCLDRLEKVDPTPEAAVRDCAKMISYRQLKDGDEPAYLLSEIRRCHDGIDLGREMITSYRNLSCDVYPDDDKEVGYRNLKMLQLMKLGGLHAHIPAIEDDVLTQIRTNMDELTLDMVTATAKTAKLKV